MNRSVSSLHRSKSNLGFLTLVFWLVTASAFAGGLGIPTQNVGLGFGNLDDFTGVRFNFSDRGIERMSGLHMSLWSPGKNPYARYEGISLGLVGLSGASMRGIGIAGIGLGVDEFEGIGIGGIGLGVNRMQGIGFGLVGIGGDRITGIAIGGIGVGADRIKGLTLGGIGVGGEEITGITLGGIGVGGETISGLAAGLIGVGGQDLTGIFFGGVGVGGENIKGLAIGGAVGGEHLEGACLSVCYLKGDTLRGFGTGAYTNVKRSTGLTIGLINRTDVLDGIQIGLLNYAGNNPAAARLLPGINVHF